MAAGEFGFRVTTDPGLMGPALRAEFMNALQTKTFDSWATQRDRDRALDGARYAEYEIDQSMVNAAFAHDCDAAIARIRTDPRVAFGAGRAGTLRAAKRVLANAGRKLHAYATMMFYGACASGNMDILKWVITQSSVDVIPGLQYSLRAPTDNVWTFLTDHGVFPNQAHLQEAIRLNCLWAADKLAGKFAFDILDCRTPEMYKCLQKHLLVSSDEGVQELVDAAFARNDVRLINYLDGEPSAHAVENHTTMQNVSVVPRRYFDLLRKSPITDPSVLSFLGH